MLTFETTAARSELELVFEVLPVEPADALVAEELAFAPLAPLLLARASSMSGSVLEIVTRNLSTTRLIIGNKLPTAQFNVKASPLPIEVIHSRA